MELEFETALKTTLRLGMKCYAQCLCKKSMVDFTEVS